VLRASSPRPANRRVTVLAYAAGEEDFFDANGNNVCDNCDATAGQEFAPSSDKSPDVFRDDNEDGAWSPGEPCIGPNSTGNCNTPGDGRYNGVLRAPRVQSSQALYVSRQIVHILSGSDAVISFSAPALACPSNGVAEVLVTVTDDIGSIMPANTVVAFNATVGTASPSSVKVPNVVLGIGQPVSVPTYLVTVACPKDPVSGRLFVNVTTPNGVLTSASIPIN